MAPKPGRSSIGVRVRPNANDFIKDLERQLAGKKHTFYVNVHADMKPANKDIGEWAKGPLKKIRASIPVGANMFPATKDLADWRRRQASNKTNIPIGLKLDGAYSQLITFRKVAGADIEVKLKVNVDSANKAAERFEQALARRGINVPFGIEVDGNQVDRVVEKAQRAASKKKVKTPLELEVENAQTQLRNLQISAAAKKLGVKVDIDADPKKAELQLKLLRARAQANKIEVGLDVKRSGLDNFNKAIAGIEKKLGGGSIIRSLDFGPLNLGKPGGLMGTLTTINLLAGAVPGAVFAITGLSKAIMDLAGAASIAPGALGGLLASIGTFSVGVSGMSDAFSALTDMWSETGSEAASTARRSVQAHNQLRQATRDEAQAQRDVASARREATNDLRNLNNELRGGVLNEAQAILDLQKARDRYAQGGFENSTERKQAELDILKAQDNITNVRERNNQLQQKANEEGAKGVEGSDKVTQAQERVTRAAEATAQALEAIQSAQATGVMGKFQDEIEQLTPSARDFVMVLAGMRGPLLDIRNMVQETMFADTAPAFQGFLDRLLPIVGPGMQRIAGAMNKSILQVFDSLGGPQGQSIIERILGGTAEAQEGITKLIDPVTRGLGTLMAAGAEHLPQVVDLFGRLADRFATFIEEADKNGSLDAFMDRGIGALEKMAELGINLIQIVNNLGGAFEGDMLQGLVDVTQKFEDWIVSAEGQQKINQWIQDAKDLWEDWRPVLQDLPEIFDAVSGAAKTLIDGITPFLNFFTSVMKEAPGLVQGFVGVWLGSKLITGFLSPVASLLGGILKGFRSLPGLAAAAANAASGLPAALGGGGAGTAGGAAATGAGAGLGATAAAAVPFVGTVGAFLLAGQAIYDSASDEDKKIAGTDITSDDLANARTGGRGTSVSNAHPVQRIDPNKPPAFGTPEYGFLADAVKAGKFKEKFPNIGVGDDGHLIDTTTGQVLPGFMSGGYTDWGAKSGRPIIAHGGEYIEPKPTVDHYGVDAMRAVHQKRATISYEVGGSVPMAFVNPIHQSVGANNPGGVGASIGATSPGGGPPHGVYTGEIIDPSRNWPGPVTGPVLPQTPGQESVKSPGWGKLLPNYQGPYVPGFEGGGLVYDPTTGTYKPSENGVIQHGQNTAGAAQSPGIVDSLSTGLTQGLSSVLNRISPSAASGPNVPGSPGYTGTTGAAPGIGNGADSTTGGGTSPFLTGILGNVGIPGLGGDGKQDQGPGWGPGGAPEGLGGGDGFDIRRFGIGPGPVGSGPNDWQQAGGEIVGKFGAGLVGAFSKGFLGFFGLEGTLGSPYFAGATGLASHFLNPDQTGVQASGSEETNAQVDNLMNTYDTMPQNPADINAAPAGLPNVFDPSTGTAVNPMGAGNQGLQTNTLRGKAIIQKMFPWATNIGGVRQDSLKWHPSGLALDVMTDPDHGNNDPPSPQGLAKGNQLYRWLEAHKSDLGIDYLMWGPITGDKDHYNHIHVNFAASGFGPGSIPATFANANAKPLWGAGAPPKGGAPTPKKGAPAPKKKGGLFGPAIQGGSLPLGVVPPKPPPPRPPDIIKMRPPAPKPSVAPPAPVAPPPMVEPAPVAPPAPEIHGAPGYGPPGPPAAPTPGVGGPTVMPAQIGTGVGPGEDGSHLHPAAKKGIASAAATIGSLADTAVAVASMGATMGAGGGAAGAIGKGMGGGGGGGLSVGGLIQQGGKIIEDIANVGASFLVGTITNGTTENPYGVTQRGSNPTGGTRVNDNSTHYHGNMVTNNLDEYFQRMDLREKQKQQASLGRFG